MEGRVKITENELLDALRAACVQTDGPSDVMTSREMAATTGLSASTVSRCLGLLGRRGLLSCVHVHRPSIDGRAMSVPAYRILRAKKGKAA